MKIVGITKERQLYVKPDSALLVGNKPFFIPLFSDCISASFALVGRVCRLGRNIQEKFASRYLDAFAPALNLQADDMQNWTERTGFDNSLVLGQFQTDMPQHLRFQENEDTVADFSAEDLSMSMFEAVEYVSRFVTLRMGDMVAVDFKASEARLKKETVWKGFMGEEQKLYCKIK